MCREFMLYPWALPPSNRSSKLFSHQYLCSKLSLRKVMRGGREAERLFLVLVLAAFLDFAFNLFASLWCRYLGSSTKKYWEELFASCLLCLLCLWACHTYQCCTQWAGELLLQQSGGEWLSCISQKWSGECKFQRDLPELWQQSLTALPVVSL